MPASRPMAYCILMASYRLIVTEKPSVARDIGRVLGVEQRRNGFLEGRGVRITWCVGHLLELAEPTRYNPDWRRWSLDSLPMLPDRFELQPRKSARDQYDVVAKQLADATEVINACDAGREGELIFSWVYEFAGCTAPVRRLWISSMTDAAIKKGFGELRDGALLTPLQDAARCRAEADWLVGLNATRAMTTRFSSGGDRVLLSVGRVQTPTLALLVRREHEIAAFVAEPFWQVKVRLGAEKGEWDAIWTDPRAPKGDTADRLTDKDAATVIAARLRGANGTVSRVNRKKSHEKPPLLYDLTSLQKEANRRFKLSAKRTLELAQSLYETHKLLTYPRTDSRHLSEDEVPGLPDKLRGIAFGPYEQAAQDILERWPVKLTKRVIDDAEVSDHHAIIPTGVDPRGARLNVEEKRIFDLVARRTLAVMMPDAVFAVAAVDVRIGGDLLVAKGRTCLDLGWRSIDPPHTTKKELLLPPVDKGDAAKALKVRVHEGTTMPPRRYTEGTLLAAMESAGSELKDKELMRAMKRNGLGTPATRAAIIETLIARRYIAREPPNIVATPHGMALLAALPVEGLTSPHLTGAWEARLVAMAEGREDRAAFMNDIRVFTREMIDNVRSVSDEEVRAAAFVAAKPTGDVLGDCPGCGNEVRAGERGWRCTNCTLRIPAQVARREVSATMARTLLKDRQTKPVKGFKARSGKLFAAALAFDERWQVIFVFPDPEALGDCPACKSPVRERGSVFTCDTGRECDFVMFAEMSGHKVTVADVRAVLKDGQTGPITGLQDRQGDTFAGVLAWRDGRVRAVRVDARAHAESPGACPECGAEVRFVDGRWRCGGCRFQVPGEYLQRPLGLQDVRALLERGRTFRLHGFVRRGQPDHKPFKAALVLQAGGELTLDYSKEAGDRPVPAGGPRPAFDERVDCPACADRVELQPGYVIAGKAAWGCSRWRDGCKLRVPFSIDGRPLGDEHARRLLGKDRATRYAAELSAIPGKTARIVLRPDESPCWATQERGKPAPE